MTWANHFAEDIWFYRENQVYGIGMNRLDKTLDDYGLRLPKSPLMNGGTSGRAFQLLVYRPDCLGVGEQRNGVEWKSEA